MKKVSIILVISFFIAASSVYCQNLDKILNDHFKAAGQEKMAEIETNILSGKTIIASMGMEMPFTITMSRPDKIRVESDFQGSKMIQTYNGEKGWMLAPMMGLNEPTELSDSELKMLKSQGEMDGPLWNYKEKGNKVELIGEETVNDSPAYHIKVITGDEDVMHQYIDKKSNLISKVTITQTMGGVETEIENFMSDYKTIKGIAVAHTITTQMNGQTVTKILIENIEFNKSVDPALFDKPSL